ncbi:long-chain-fatty-acid--AMP ligase FAAL26/FadD26 [Streptomonospora sediminis]
MPTASAPPEPPDLPSRIREHAARHPDAPALTFVDYAADPRGSATDWTYAEVDGHARRIAGLLGAHCRPGDTAAVLCPQGLYYAAAFLGCLYAGVRAVPLYPPQPFQRNGRLRALFGGAAPACVLTTPEHTAPIAELAAEEPGGNLPTVIDATGEAPGRGAATPCSPAPGDTAYLQYTSGSTGLPRGVRVTHANLAHTVEQSIRAYRLGPASVSVSWLPLFHDFGLATSVTVPLAIGCRAVVFDPLAFVQHPLRWLRLLSRYGGTFAPCPDFALGMVCDAADAAVTGAAGGSAGPGGFDGTAGLDGLDLSALTSLVNGSEPVRKSSLDRFTDTFAPFGFSHEAHTPAYGLAEATILVSATPPGAAPRVFACDRRELAKGQAVPSAAPDHGTARMVVECGTEWGQEFAIVDPATLVGLPPRHVGEIWVCGPAVTAGYHGSPEQTSRIYGRRRSDAAPGDDREWLRTGDLGFADEGHLFVVGRISDLVIIDGCNHHPADLESCVAAAAGAGSGLRQGHLAAVSVDDGGRERLVVIAERMERIEEGVRDEEAEGSEPGAPAANAARDPAAEHRLLLTRARAAVAEQHGITLHDLVLVAAGTLPKTSSGKLRRATCRDRYLAGDYT